MLSGIAAADGKVCVVGEDAEVLGVALPAPLGVPAGLPLGAPLWPGVPGVAGVAGVDAGGTTTLGDGLATCPDGLVISTPTPTAAATSTTIPMMIRISRRREPNGPDPLPPRPGG